MTKRNRCSGARLAQVREQQRRECDDRRTGDSIRHTLASTIRVHCRRTMARARRVVADERGAIRSRRRPAIGRELLERAITAASTCSGTSAASRASVAAVGEHVAR